MKKVFVLAMVLLSIISMYTLGFGHQSAYYVSADDEVIEWHNYNKG